MLEGREHLALLITWLALPVSSARDYLLGLGVNKAMTGRREDLRGRSVWPTAVEGREEQEAVANVLLQSWEWGWGLRD